MGQAVGEENVQIAVPLLGIGSRKAIDEVDADVCEAGQLGPIEALLGMVRIVSTAQILQVVVEKALDADAQAIDARFS